MWWCLGNNFASRSLSCENDVLLFWALQTLLIKRSSTGWALCLLNRTISFPLESQMIVFRLKHKEAGAWSVATSPTWYAPPCVYLQVQYWCQISITFQRYSCFFLTCLCAETTCDITNFLISITQILNISRTREESTKKENTSTFWKAFQISFTCFSLHRASKTAIQNSIPGTPRQKRDLG